MPLINGIAAGSDQNVGLLRMGARRYRAYLGETLVYGESDIALPPGAGKIKTNAANPIAVSERFQTSFTVWLDRRPLSSVRLTIALAEHPRNPITLVTTARPRFTRGNWNTPQTVTLEANDVPDVTDLYTSLTITGPEDQILNSVTRQIRIRNDDLLLPRLELSRDSLELGIDGDTDSFTARLSVAPSANVAVAFSELTNATTNPTSLTISPIDWDTPKTVEVTSGSNTGMETLTLTPSGGGVRADTAEVVINVVDQAQVSVSPDSLTLLEGETKELRVRVVNAPENYVVIVRVDENSPYIYAGPQLLTFTDTRDQAVNVTALRDVLTGDEDATATVRFILSGGGENYTKLVSVKIVNTGNVPLLAVSPTYLPMDQGSQATVAVKLTERPYEDVTVRASLPTRTGMLSASSLTFTRDNWDTAQELTVTAVDLVAGDEDVVAELALRGSGGGVTDTAAVSVAVFPTGALANSLIASTTAISVVTGSTAQIFASLNRIPALSYALGEPTTGTVNVAVASDDAKVAVSPAALAFDGDNWRTPVGVTLDAASASAGDSAIVTLTPSGANSDGAVRSIAVSVVADSSAGVMDMALPRFTRKDAATELVPGGPYIRELYVLDRAPAAQVDVQVSRATTAGLMQAGYSGSSNPIVLQGDPVTLSFDGSNYASGLALAARATSDANQTFGLLQYEVTAGKLASDAGFLQLPIQEPEENVNEVSPVFSTSAVSMKDGESTTVGVSLSAQPSGSITVQIVERSKRLTTSGTMLTFSPQNWHIPQDITLMALITPATASRNFSIAAYASGMGASTEPALLRVTITAVTTTTTTTTVPGVGQVIVPGNFSVTFGALVATSARVPLREAWFTWTEPAGFDGSARYDLYYTPSSDNSLSFTHRNLAREVFFAHLTPGLAYAATLNLVIPESKGIGGSSTITFLVP